MAEQALAESELERQGAVSTFEELQKEEKYRCKKNLKDIVLLSELNDKDFREGVIKHLRNNRLAASALMACISTIFKNNDTLLSVFSPKLNEIDRVFELIGEKLEACGWSTFINTIRISKLEGKDISLEGRRAIAEALHIGYNGAVAHYQEERLLNKEVDHG